METGNLFISSDVFFYCDKISYQISVFTGTKSVMFNSTEARIAKSTSYFSFHSSTIFVIPRMPPLILYEEEQSPNEVQSLI